MREIVAAALRAAITTLTAGTSPLTSYCLCAWCTTWRTDQPVTVLGEADTLDGGTNGEVVSKTGGFPHANVPASFDLYVVAPNNGGPFYRGNGLSAGAFAATASPSIGTPHVVVATETGNTVSRYLDGTVGGGGHAAVVRGDGAEHRDPDHDVRRARRATDAERG